MKCPAFGQKCHTCGKYNHYASQCFYGKSKGTTKHVHQVRDDEDDDHNATAMYVGAIYSGKRKQTVRHDDFAVTLKLNNTRIKFDIDTGAQCNVISKSVYQAVSNKQCPLLKANDVKIVTYGGHKMTISGKVLLNIQYKDKNLEQAFYVVDDNVQNVLGAETSVQMNLIKRVYALNTDPNDDNILNEFSDLFNDCGCIKDAVHHIELDKNVPPVVHAPRNVPVALRTKIKQELDRMEQLQVVEREFTNLTLPNEDS